MTQKTIKNTKADSFLRVLRAIPNAKTSFSLDRIAFIIAM